jgi:hypothetical protein
MTEPVPPPADPTRHWDGEQWLKWDGISWRPEYPEALTPDLQPAATKYRMGNVTKALALVAVLVVVAGIVTVIVLVRSSSRKDSLASLLDAIASASPTSLSVKGTLTLTDSAFSLSDVGAVCNGSGGYDDITTGAQVVVTSETGTVLATGALGAGAVLTPGSCTFDLAVPDVPPGHKFYGVTVSHRGVLQFTADQLSNVSLTLGSP